MLAAHGSSWPNRQPREVITLQAALAAAGCLALQTSAGRSLLPPSFWLLGGRFMLFMHLARLTWVDPKTPHTAHMHRQLRRRLPSQVSGSLPDPSRWMKRGLFMLFMQ